MGVSDIITCQQKMGAQEFAITTMKIMTAMCEPCPRAVAAIGKVPACVDRDELGLHELGHLKPTAATVAKPECIDVLCNIKAACPADPADTPRPEDPWNIPPTQYKEFMKVIHDNAVCPLSGSREVEVGVGLMLAVVAAVASF